MSQKDRHSGAKYVIEAKFLVEGVVERHDVIGAIFGQTEGLFPKDLELRELQKSGKIGRIDIEISSEEDTTKGAITVSSSLDRAETAIIAAAMESVDRIGPCEAKVSIEKIADIRVDKRQRIINRAKELMRDWVVKDTRDIEKILEEVAKEDKKVQPIKYGREKLTSTPDISKNEELIVVEGRADVVNLMKSGYRGVIALEGVKIPKTIINLTKKKVITAFLDGDRGGDLILKELMQVAKPRYVARAPRGKEVESLNPDEIKKALDKRIRLEEIVEFDKMSSLANSLKGTLEGVFLKRNGNQIDRVPVSELVDKLKKSKDVELVVFDGIITGRLVDSARNTGIKMIVGERIAEGVTIPPNLEVKLLNEFE